MPDSVILRFRDLLADTIDEHRAVIAASGSTWWGWWRKNSEPAFFEELESLRARVPIDIGLYDSGTQQVFIAKCTDISVSIRERVSSPDRSKTPEYYRSANLLTWFELTQIGNAIPLAEVSTKFGVIETAGETIAFTTANTSTFAEASTREGSAQNQWDALSPFIQNLSMRVAVTPRDEFSNGTITTSIGRDEIHVHGELILCISDLHFGPSHGFPLRTEPGQPSSLTDRMRDFQALLESQGKTVGVVVVGGDLTSKGQGFAQAGKFLEEVASTFSLRPSDFIIVPGNHDISLDEYDAQTYGHEDAYRQFLRAFTLTDSKELDGVRSFRTPSGAQYMFVWLNSVRLRGKETKEFGFVGSDVFDPIFSRVTPRVSDVDSFRIGVLHHHLLPTSRTVFIPQDNRQASITLDAGGILEAAQEHDFDLLIHGHQHLPFIGSTSRVRLRTSEEGVGTLTDSLYVLGLGSAGVCVDLLDAEFPFNTVATIEPDDRSLEVSFWQFNKVMRPSVMAEARLMLRASGTSSQ
jgi:predicted phosphodiesterase